MSITEQKLEEILDKKFDNFVKTVFTPLKDSISELQKSLNFLSDQYEDLRKEVGTLRVDNTRLCAENNCLKAEMRSLVNEINVQKNALNEHNQYIRRECLEFSGVPERQGENTNQIVMDICEEIGIKIVEEDISVSHRLPTKRTEQTDRPKKIIARFVRRDVRDAIYKSRKLLKNKTTSDIGYPRTNNKIYISENLTPTNKDLFNKSLALKKRANFRFLWTRYGNTYMKKDEDSAVIQIATEKDLEKLDSWD